MDIDTKTKLQNEMATLKGQMYAMDGMISTVSTAASMPIMVSPTLPPITIQGFDKVAKVLEQQQKNLVKLTSLAEALLDAS